MPNNNDISQFIVLYAIFLVPACGVALWHFGSGWFASLFKEMYDDDKRYKKVTSLLTPEQYADGMRKVLCGVRVTQYILPDGRKRDVYVEVSPDHKMKSGNMLFSCELLQTGVVAFYGRYTDQDEENELCEVVPNNPEASTKALEHIIDTLVASNHP